MKKNLFFVLFFTIAAFAEKGIPALPPYPCLEGCTFFMKTLLNEFENLGSSPTVKPTVYSGVCHHLGFYDPHIEHYGVVLLDLINNEQRFGGQFSFFTSQNDYVNWTLEKARSEIQEGWERYGKTILEESTLRCEIRNNEGQYEMAYWMRQNPNTQELLLIYYSGTVQKSFCRLRAHDYK